ncbi:MAG: signal recognition particle protein [Dethiobacteria bacterium]
MFNSLSEKIQDVFKRLKGKGKLNEKDVEAALREIRIALLEADVNFKVVKSLISAVKERSVGHEVLKSLSPAQQVIKIVREELTALLEQDNSQIKMASTPPTIILLAGIQGAGKTTTAVKLAFHLRGKGQRPLLVAADLQRPGAIEQIKIYAAEVSLPVYAGGDTPLDVCRKAISYAESEDHDVIIVDTTGRLHVADDLMEELSLLQETLNPQEVLLVVDAMTGQDAVNIAEEFNKKVSLTGVILTKLDGDTRGGSALSIKTVTGCPIKFIGTGEKIEGLEPFYPDRMVKRILGMGDILSLIEKAESALDKEKAAELEKKLYSQQFTLEDFQEQLVQIKKMGSLNEIIDLIPGGAGIPREIKDLSLGEKQLVVTEAIINSMTRSERVNPHMINSSRRKRIAMGSGTNVQDVNRLLKQFEQMKKMMKRLGAMEKKGFKKFKRNKGFPFM